jgi:4-carboxymuconolactone decarboxylase
MDERERWERGMAIRRAVLGDAHVDHAQAARTDLTAEFQDLLTRYAWGEIWARPGLSPNTRSLVTVAMLVALNRPEELRMHLRAAGACGVTRDELREVLLHAALYCGLPAANAAFHLAEAELPPAGPDPGDPADRGDER